MSLFSLLTLSITKNSPQDEQGQTPLSPSQSCAGENGMDTAEWESHPLLPPYTQLPDVGQEGARSWLLQRLLAVWVT